MAGWPESRACLSAGWARHRAHSRTYKRTQVVRAVNGPAAYERRARCAPPGESGQPSAYDLRKFGPAEHHAYHSMVLVECAIVTNRVPVLAGHAWPNLKGHINRIHQPATVGRRVLRWPSGTTTAGANKKATSTRCESSEGRLCSTRTWSGAKGEHAALAHEPRGGPLQQDIAA